MISSRNNIAFPRRACWIDNNADRRRLTSGESEENMQTIKSGKRVFEVVDKVPAGYMIFHIGSHMIDGYLPLCQLKPPEEQPFEGGRSIRTDTLKAIKLEGAQIVLAAMGDTKKDMERYVKRYCKSKTPYVVRRVERAKAALEAMKEIEWE